MDIPNNLNGLNKAINDYFAEYGIKPLEEIRVWKEGERYYCTPASTQELYASLRDVKLNGEGYVDVTGEEPPREPSESYTVHYWHGDDETPGTLELTAYGDEGVKLQAQKFVETGFLNKTGISVALKGGGEYVCRNVHGSALCFTVEGKVVTPA